jgi:hypothetical protein
LKPPFKCATGAKDLQANIIVTLVFVSGGQQFLFGFGPLISDFLVFVKITSFFFSKYSLFFSALAALGMFFLLSLLFGSILYLLWLGSREGFCNGNVRGTVFLLMWSNEKCSQASFPGGNLLETCLLFPPHILYWKMLRNNSANSKQNQLKLKSENNSCRSGLWFLGWSSFSWGLSWAPFPLGLIPQGLTILVQSQGIISFLKATVSKVAMGTGPWAFWSIMSWDLRRFLGLGLSWAIFLLGFGFCDSYFLQRRDW